MAAAARSPQTFKLIPSQCATAIRGLYPTKRALFMWGPPGISKSATAQQVAKADGMGFVDVRLSQMDPTDLRGIPFPVIENGIHGVRWSAPIVLPRNLDFNQLLEIEAEEHEIRFENPLGATPIINVKYVKSRGDTIPLTAVIVSETENSFIVKLIDDKGDIQPGKVRWTVSGDVKAILALEEFNSAPPSVQAAAYQLVLDRKLGEYEVPDGVFIIAMGNRDTDKGVTFKMPTPIANRFVHIEMEHNFDDWQRWAVSDGVHQQVIGYLNAFKGELFQFDPGTAARGFATPRSWHFVSDILRHNEDMPESVLRALIAGSVGDGLAVKFMNFRKVANDLPKNDMVLNGTLKKMPSDKRTEVSLAYALTTSLCYELKERSERNKREGSNPKAMTQWLEEADNFLEFIMTNFAAEICIMGAKQSISMHKLPFNTQKMKHFDTFATKYKDYIMS